MEWEARVRELQPGRVWEFLLFPRHDDDANPCMLSFADVVQLWEHDATFAEWFTKLLAQQPSPAFRFETQAINASMIDRQFKFVLVDSPALAGIQADASPFAKPLSAGDPQDSVIAFPNLRGDAEMIVPRALTDESAYAHLAAFVRHAPPAQQRELWRTVAKTIRRWLTTEPMWLSTAGLGVSWLHVRLDSTPKYYSYRPYAVDDR